MRDILVYVHCYFFVIARDHRNVCGHFMVGRVCFNVVLVSGHGLLVKNNFSRGSSRCQGPLLIFVIGNSNVKTAIFLHSYLFNFLNIFQ